MVNQDKWGLAGHRIRVEPTGLYETWAKPLSDGSFAVILYHRNESCLPNDDSMIHVDPNPQVFFRSLGFTGEAEIVDLWTNTSLGIFNHYFPDAYSKATIPPRGHLFVKVIPKPSAYFGNMMAPHECPAWGCHISKKIAQMIQ